MARALVPANPSSFSVSSAAATIRSLVVAGEIGSNFFLCLATCEFEHTLNPAASGTPCQGAFRVAIGLGCPPTVLRQADHAGAKGGRSYPRVRHQLAGCRPLARGHRSSGMDVVLSSR